MIEVRNLGKNYGTFPAVKGINFDVSSGEIVGLLGPNGAGKTTVIKILTCYFFPSFGTAKLNQLDVFENSLEIRRIVGYLPETAPLYTDLNVHEYLDFIADARGITGADKKQRIEWVVEQCGLKEVIHKSIDDLSKGYRQRTGLAQAILHDPKILILDEPTSGLDPNQIIEIRDLIRRLGEKKTVILSTHILQEVEAVCKKVFILNEGKIVANGTPEDIGKELQQGETIILFTIKASNIDSVRDSLSSIPGFRQVLDFTKTEQDKANIKIALSGNADSTDAQCEQVFSWAIAQKYMILSLTPEKIKLEDIFTKLTKEGGRA